VYRQVEQYLREWRRRSVIYNDDLKEIGRVIERKQGLHTGTSLRRTVPCGYNHRYGGPPDRRGLRRPGDDAPFGKTIEEGYRVGQRYISLFG
jgi:hypothetical protein